MPALPATARLLGRAGQPSGELLFVCQDGVRSYHLPAIYRDAQLGQAWFRCLLCLG
jgi:hypothetical protein